MGLTLLFQAGRAAIGSTVVISEIHYHPLGGGRDLEFVELANRTPEPLDLSGWSFTDGISFTFPAETWLEGWSVLVVCANRARLAEVYGIENALGNFGAECVGGEGNGCRLDDGGERITLIEPGGALHTSVRYLDHGHWPAAADGTGHSLELRSLALDPEDPDSWRESLDLGGSPGRSNPPDRAARDLRLGEIGIGPDSRGWIELVSLRDTPFDISGFHLSDTRGDPKRGTIPAGFVISEANRIVIDATTLGLSLGEDSQPGERTFLSLAGPDGAILDAWNVILSRDGASVARFPEIADGIRIEEVAEPTPGEPNRLGAEGGIVINEISYHPPSDDPNDEWIELHNRSEHAVDLGGWKLDGGVRFEFPGEAAIQPGGFLVVARDPARVREVYGLEDSIVVGPDPRDEAAKLELGTLSNRGETLTLRDRRGRTVDEVSFRDGGEWPRWADGGGSSLELIDPFADNAAPGAWDASDDSNAAPITFHEYSGRMHTRGESELRFILLGAGIVLIDDLSVRRVARGDESEDGPELVANGDFEVPLSIRDGSPGTWFIEGTHVRSGRTSTNPIAGRSSFAIVASGRGDNLVNRVEYTLPRLEEGRDYRISFHARWVIGSTSLITQGWDNAFPHEHQLSRPRRLGTPGRPNGRVRALGPTITDFEQEPRAPLPNEPVEISVRVTSPAEKVMVTLRVSTAGALGDEDPRWAVIPMRGPDSQGRFRASFPGAGEETTITYAIDATDELGHRSRYPRDRSLGTCPLEAAPGSLAISERGWIHTRPEPVARSNHRVYRVWLDSATEAALDGRRLLSNDLASGTLVVDRSAIYPETGIRFAGSPFARKAWEGSLRLRPPRDRPLDGSHGRFNLEEHQGEGGLDARERISSYIFRHFQGPKGVPWSEAWLVDVRVNDRAAGTREHVVPPGKDLLRRFFPEDDDGLLVEMDDRHVVDDQGRRVLSVDARLLAPPWPDRAARLALAPDDPELYRWHFEPRAGSDGASLAPVIELAKLFDPGRTSDTLFDDAVENALDVEGFLRVFAVRRNTDDWDTWGGRRGKNAYLYRSEREGWWTLIPWDMELTFETPTAFLPASIDGPETTPFPEVTRFLDRPALRRRYLRLLVDLVEGPLSSGFLSPYLDRLEDRGMSNVDVGRPGGFVDVRNRLLRELLSPAMVPRTKFEISRVDVEKAKGLATFTGVAPLDVAAVVVRVPPESPRDEGQRIVAGLGVDRPLGWSAAVALPPGEHAVEALAFDDDGNLVAASEVKVHIERTDRVFVRGDADQSGSVNIADAVHILRAGLGRDNAACRDAADVNDDGELDLSDAVALLRWLFADGAPPALPFPEAGMDPTPDGLGCG